MSLSRYSIEAARRLKQIARELTQAKELCFEECKQRQLTQAELSRAQARVEELERSEAKWIGWETRKKQITRNLDAMPALVK